MPIEERVFIAGAGPVGLAAAADPERTHDYLIRVSMIASLRRAAALEHDPEKAWPRT